MSSRRAALGSFLVVLAVSLGGAAGLSCKGSGGKADPSAAGAGGAGKGGKGGKGGATGGFAVDLMDLEAKKLDYVVTAPGSIEAFERVQVTARVAGVVDKVAFVDGQSVKKGDVLVLIDSERYRLGVNSARAQLAKSEAAQKDTEAMVARREGASEQHPGLIPGEELETYRTKSLTAKADTAVSAEAVKVAELNLRDSAVRAPIEGVIQTRTVETGQYVQAGYVMATLLRQSPLLLRFPVEPQDAPRLKVGMGASFTLRETQRTFTAKITLVSAAADPQTHLVGVTAEVDDTDHKYWLRPGSFVDVSVDVGASRDAVVVPRSAVRATDHGYVGFVVDGDTAHERVVGLGMSTKDGWVEVRTGLKAGEKLVVRGAEALTEGAKVKVGRAAPDGGVDEPAAPREGANDPEKSGEAKGKPRDGDGGGGGGRRGRDGGHGGAGGPGGGAP
jgi:RND family efflux transporter MFP subunit